MACPASWWRVPFSHSRREREQTAAARALPVRPTGSVDHRPPSIKENSQ